MSDQDPKTAHPSSVYLGDGVYAGFDGFCIWLETQEGKGVALEAEVFWKLMEYMEDLREFYHHRGLGPAFDGLNFPRIPLLKTRRT